MLLPFTRSAVVALFALLVINTNASETDWRAKVDPRIFNQRTPTQEILIFLDQQADLSAAKSYTKKSQRTEYVFNQLRATAESSQADLISRLKRDGIPHRSFWIANMVWVSGDMSLIQDLASRNDVQKVYANAEMVMDTPMPTAVSKRQGDGGIEPNLMQIGATDFWAAGFTGQGIVVGGQDTGYDWDHPALQTAYRGWDGTSADHNYNWHDAIHGGNDNVCGFDSPEPCDDVNHGSHTMGIMIGDDGAGNQIGVAPGARWIGCRNMNRGRGTPASYSECFQWFVAPTDLNNENPDPSRAPHVINNSWSCPDSEGCVDPKILKGVVENTRAAGILVVVSAGNNGLSCETVATPAAIYDASLTVGALNGTDTIASFSSRGPVTVDGSNRLKPDLSAPGVSIRSSINMPFLGYAPFSGTSMAAPHVVGAAALLMSRYPVLIGRPELIEQHLIDNVLPRTFTQNCGGDTSASVPNHVYGYGSLRLTEFQLPVLLTDGFEEPPPGNQ